MDASERKKAERGRRAEFILDAAEALVFERGFADVTMDDIARASGYTKRSVYLYFRDRDEVFFALVLRGQRLLLSALKAASAEASERGGVIRAFGTAYYRFSLEHPEYFSLVMEYESERHAYATGRVTGDSLRAACQNLSVDYGALLAEALERDLSSGRMRSDLGPFPTMMLLWGQMFGVMQILLMRREGFEAIYGLDQDAFFESFLGRLEASYRP